ncbi:unnamed protein product [Menidia menidia]|uniref:(Atlantic silverside) hypothetical protein n=1 Tax=Menidia menidia TaxID=238744 RepID=A0A8S4BUK1_9TELE|nr:unnamed protein product [Menidia menidia]
MSEEQTVSLVDVLQEDQELEEEASAVLAGSDSDHCSYPEFRPLSEVDSEMDRWIGVRVSLVRWGQRELNQKEKLSVVEDSARPSKRSREEAESSCRLKDLHPGGPDRVQQGALESSCRLKDLHPGGPARVQQGALESSCRLKDLHPGGPARVQQGAVFWPSAWRSKLCPCSSCQVNPNHNPNPTPPPPTPSPYPYPSPPPASDQPSAHQELLARAGLSFLLDESDTVLAYENKGKSSEQRPGPDPLMSALDSLNRVQQLEIIHGYNDMKTELKDFLQRFATEGKVVTSEDIRHFFEQQGRKRRRVDGESFH